MVSAMDHCSAAHMWSVVLPNPGRSSDGPWSIWDTFTEIW